MDNVQDCDSYMQSVAYPCCSKSHTSWELVWDELPSNQLLHGFALATAANCIPNIPLLLSQCIIAVKRQGKEVAKLKCEVGVVREGAGG
jgi:hypothetical protein